MIPLELTPLYSADSYPNKFWDAPRNTTAWSVFMYELVRAGNAITDLLLQTTRPMLPDAHIGGSHMCPVSILHTLLVSLLATFDAYAFFTDMYTNPSAYLNGTGPLDVTGCIYSCVMQPDESGTDSLSCTMVEGEGLRDGYLWCVLFCLDS